VKDVERLMVANTSGQINVRLSYKAHEKGKQMKPGGKKKERGRNRSLTPCLLWKQGRISYIVSAESSLRSFYGLRDKVDPVRKSRRSLQCGSRSYVQGRAAWRNSDVRPSVALSTAWVGTLCTWGWVGHGVIGGRRFRIAVPMRVCATGLC